VLKNDMATHPPANLSRTCRQHSKLSLVVCIVRMRKHKST
jgi:hypothetical protein